MTLHFFPFSTMSSPSLPRSPSSSSLSSESSLSDSDSDSGSESCSSSPISSSESTPWYFPAPPSPPASPMGGSGVVRWQGPISIRQDSAEDGVRRTSWVWKNKWLALTATSLTLHQWEPSPQQWVVPLCDVTVIARSDLTPYCLLLETQDLARWYLSFKHEEEMRGASSALS
ncbi:hypothetical protein B0H19DRAFT_421598 [Mycena capillaripes]|nr:hypothetical protein B0H19DRAFT_421598 [Mycena capillaripes]